MTAPAIFADSMICARCDGPMVITQDALGRPRKRCPRCDGVSRVRRHPDEVRVPITLGKLTADALPPVAPGQLRCQRCAKGVDGNVRFHPECMAAYQLAKKQRRCSCGALFVRPQGSRADACPACLARRRQKGATQVCTGCNRIRKREGRQRLVVSSCPDCRPAAASMTVCACGNRWPREPWKRARVGSCSACRPRVARPPRIPRQKPPAVRDGCGHPYPRRRGRRSRECETCLALAAGTTNRGVAA